MHLYNRRDHDQLPMFRDDEDRRVFMSMIKVRLSMQDHKDASGRDHKSFVDDVELITANPLSSHYHAIVKELRANGRARFMQSLMSSYTRYYNKRYGTSGPLCPGEYRSTPIRSTKELRWKIGYVNANHKRLGVDYPFSCHKYFMTDDPPSWIRSDLGLAAFGGRDAYLEYMRRRSIRGQFDDEFF